MKFTAAIVLAAAAGAAAWGNDTIVTTEVVDVYTTYCPAATEITHGSKTYTVTEATTLTITDCPCTITRPVTTTSSVYCPPTDVPAPPPPAYTNGTWTTTVAPTGGVIPVPTTGTVPPAVPTGGAGKAAALSGAGLAGIVGLAAFIL